MSVKFTIKEKDIKALQDYFKVAGKEKQEAMMKEVKLAGELTASKTKVLLNATPGAGGKVGRIVTGRLINSYHAENADTRGFGYVDRTGQNFKGAFSIRPALNEVLVGSNVIYAQFIEAKDGTFKQAFEAETKELINRLKKLL